MKVVSAYFLMAITLFNCFGAYFSFKVIRNDLIAIEEMTALESHVSEKIKEETGSDFHLTVIDKSRLNSLGYGNTFVFEEEVDGDTVYLQIDPIQYDIEKTVAEQSQNPVNNSSRDMTLLGMLLPQFILNKTTQTPSVFATNTSKTYGIMASQMKGNHNPSINTPPPELA